MAQCLEWVEHTSTAKANRHVMTLYCQILFSANSPFLRILPLMQMEELACYLPGNLALGVAEGAVVGEKAVQYATIAEELTHTCRRMYSLLPAGRLCSSFALP